MSHVTKLPPFPARADDAHKGQVGRLVIIGGRFDGIGMIGAPALAANAAFRAGSGLIQILTTPEAQLPIAVLAPCATTRALHPPDAKRLAVIVQEFDADVAAIGPGLTPQITGEDILTFVARFDRAIVIDADGLNTLASAGPWRANRPSQVVVTPHAGEMRRLLAGAGLKKDVGDREGCARALADATNSVVTLKGAGTVVTDGQRTYINRTGHSGMATAGAGDVLTGVIASLIGQGMPTFEAAVLGVYLHGLAGDLAGERLGCVSIIATDLVDALAEAVEAHNDNA